ncbi:hypothetical protein BDW62DRAFT_34108 [Aspergillus aurantiobrunneus]
MTIVTIRERKVLLKDQKSSPNFGFSGDLIGPHPPRMSQFPHASFGIAGWSSLSPRGLSGSRGSSAPHRFYQDPIRQRSIHSLGPGPSMWLQLASSSSWRECVREVTSVRFAVRSAESNEVICISQRRLHAKLYYWRTIGLPIKSSIITS